MSISMPPSLVSTIWRATIRCRRFSKVISGQCSNDPIGTRFLVTDYGSPTPVLGLDYCAPARQNRRAMTIHAPDLLPATASPAAAKEGEAGGVLTIDLTAIEANWRKLASMTVPVECA